MTVLPLFQFGFSIFLLIAVTRTFKNMVSNSGKIGHPCLFLILKEMLSVFQHWAWCLLWICHIWPYYVKIGSLCVHFLEFFFLNHKWVITYQMIFLYLLTWSCGICLLWCAVLPGLTYICWTILVTLDESNFIMLYDPFYVLLDLVSKYFFDDFCICTNERYWPIIFFS